MIPQAGAMPDRAGVLPAQESPLPRARVPGVCQEDGDPGVPGLSPVASGQLRPDPAQAQLPHQGGLLLPPGGPDGPGQ